MAGAQAISSWSWCPLSFFRALSRRCSCLRNSRIASVVNLALPLGYSFCNGRGGRVSCTSVQGCVCQVLQTWTSAHGDAQELDSEVAAEIWGAMPSPFGAVGLYSVPSMRIYRRAKSRGRAGTPRLHAPGGWRASELACIPQIRRLRLFHGPLPGRHELGAALGAFANPCTCFHIDPGMNEI
jgi:hypothetical protein